MDLANAFAVESKIDEGGQDSAGEDQLDRKLWGVELSRGRFLDVVAR